MFRVHIEIEGRLIPVDSEEDLRRLHELLGWRLSIGDKAKSGIALSHSVLDAESIIGLNALVGLKSKKPKIMKPRPAPIFRPLKGKRTVDFAKMVLANAGSGIKSEELANDMKKRGWFTNSKSPARVVDATLRKPEYADLFEYDPHWGWSLRHKQQ